MFVPIFHNWSNVMVVINRPLMLSSIVDMLTELIEERDDPRLQQARELMETALDDRRDDRFNPTD
jgi:hypothetical protein